MTYFLNQDADLSQAKPRGRDAQPSGLWEGLGASFDKAALENDANFRLSREKQDTSRTLAAQAWDRLGDDRVRAGLKDKNIYIAGKNSEEAIASNMRAIPSILEMAREDASVNPQNWSDLDVSEDGIDASINARLQAEHQDAEAVLNMMPAWRGAADLLGGLTGMTMDIKNLPFILGGGGGSILRVMGREALLNTAAEGAFIPAQFEMAERLGIEDPDVVTQLAMAAGAGAILGGGIEAGSRAFAYWRGRNALPATADPVFDAGAMDAAEDAIVAGQNPFEAAQRVQADAPTRAPDQQPDPPIEAGMVRMYHGGIKHGDLTADYTSQPTWFSSSREYAEQYASKSNGSVWYVDVPEDSDFLEGPRINNWQTSASKALAAEDFGGLKPIGYSTRKREPLILRDPVDADMGNPITEPQAVETTPQTLDEILTSEILDPRKEEMRIIDDGADEAIAELMANDSGASKPLVSWLRNNHRVSKKDMREADKAGRQLPSGGANMQVNPSGPAGRELKSMGVTPKTAPGLFSKNGRNDFDNLVAEEMEDTFPGITAAAGMSDDGIYLSRQGFLDLIVRDANGDSSWLANRAEVARIEADRDAAFRQLEDGSTSPADDFTSGMVANDGFFVDLDGYAFTHADGGASQIKADFDAYVRRAWSDFPLTPDERLEILNELQTNGGDAKYLVERVLERDKDYANLDAKDADDYGQYDHDEYLRYLDQSEAGRILDGSESGIGRPDEDTQPARSGAEGGYGDRGPYQTETTGAGTQTLIDGVAPITQRDRLEARQNAPLGGGRQAQPDSAIGGLFDPDDKVRNDLFSEPTAPQARAAQDAMRADVEDQIELDGDFSVDLDDGFGSRPASSVLAEFDADDEFQAILDACGKGRTT